MERIKIYELKEIYVIPINGTSQTIAKYIELEQPINDEFDFDLSPIVIREFYSLYSGTSYNIKCILLPVKKSGGLYLGKTFKEAYKYLTSLGLHY